VLAAALVEGALTFVVKHARSKQAGPFRSGAKLTAELIVRSAFDWLERFPPDPR